LKVYGRINIAIAGRTRVDSLGVRGKKAALPALAVGKHTSTKFPNPPNGGFFIFIITNQLQKMLPE